MDSTAYKYLIRDLQEKPDPGFTDLPITFVKSPVAVTAESLSSLQLFLRAIIGEFGANGRVLLPEMLNVPGNFFAQLFLAAHKALLEVVAGADPLTHGFRVNGSQLVKFLCFCVQGDKAVIAPQTDITSSAMYCFLLEGLMHAGWCPNSCEGIAKRSAHAYFLALRKGLHGLGKTSHATILGYLWGAWLLAQRTEGIHDTSAERIPSFTETFAWRLDGISYSYISRNSVRPRLFHVLARNSSSIPHPFSRLSLDGSLGLTLYANGEVIRPVSLEEVSDIVRPKADGNKFVFTCGSASVPALWWTAVFLALENTTYRIDILRLPPTAETLEIRGELRLENEAILERQGDNCYFGRDVENTVIRFVENPLDFRFVGQQGTAVSVFASGVTAVSAGASLTMVTAWARGKGITAINETKLLGVYD